MSGEAAGGELTRQAVLLEEGVLKAMFWTKVKIATLLFLTLGILTAGGVLTHRALPAAPLQEKGTAESPKADRKSSASAPRKVPKELLEKRLEAARKVYELHLKRIRGGQGLPNELYGWSEHWFEAEMALSDKKADRIKALAAHVDRTREEERLMIAYARSGQGRQADADAATYYRVSAEIQFFEATGELPPKRPQEARPARPPNARSAGKGGEELLPPAPGK
jgi:hypothetical protein